MTEVREEGREKKKKVEQEATRGRWPQDVESRDTENA